MYHRVRPFEQFDQLTVAPERFADHMTWVKNKITVQSLSSAVQALAGPAITRSTLVVTFDDGYRDNLFYALPVLQRLGIPATIFVTTDFCNQTTRHPRYQNESGQLHLNWAEVRDLAALPGITIGSHTLTHPYLRQISSAAVRMEIGDSRKRIEDQIGQPVEFFCYPSGDVGVREIEIAREAGYSASVTVRPGLNRAGRDLQRLCRTEMTQNDTRLDVALKLQGSYDPVHMLLHWRRRNELAALARSAEH